MNRLEKILSVDLREKALNNRDEKYISSAERTEYSCKKDDEIIYVFTVYKFGEEYGVNKYVCGNDEDVLSSLEEMEKLKAEGYTIMPIE
jgi:hypothetical protein